MMETALEELLSIALDEHIIGGYCILPECVRVRHRSSLMDLEQEEARAFLAALIRQHRKYRGIAEA